MEPGLGRFLSRVFSLPLVGLVKVYQYTLGVFLPNSCRYQPTCSNYALEALRLWGPFKGTWLAIKRISRCHPWGGHGFDPVPKPPRSSSKGS
ncbi:membrane protein insertion efficiency factor YidD [bacterium]|nr:membrane protein insertion efficiency factor YidD [bacterium]